MGITAMQTRQSVRCREDWEHVGYSEGYGKATRLSGMERKKSEKIKTQTINTTESLIQRLQGSLLYSIVGLTCKAFRVVRARCNG